MTPQERSMLEELIGRVSNTRLAEKDPEAEGLLQQRLGSNPDALYMLAQTVLVQNYALNQAKAQIDHLRQQPALQQPAMQQKEPSKITSFLGDFFGRHEEPHQGQPQPARSYAQPAPNSGYAPVNPGYGNAPQPMPMSGGSSFLRSAATTAAGVAAGALAFQGVESLLHGFGGGGSFLGGGGYGGGGETVINNYYDDPNSAAAGGQGFADDTVRSDDRTADERLQDAQLTAQQDDGSFNPQLDQADEASVSDDSSVSADDSSSFDDSSLGGDGFDDGGSFSGDDSSFS